ncbi:plasmid mobilization relaxosome protein MobC [bacterium]|nr:plasmid mobilization relaxosome protein MobC [bacterium]MBR1810184.1 plasmid mobilization relaxosome protein MobC [Clostridia bacterium]
MKCIRNNRTEVLTFRTTPEEKEIILSKAEKANLKLSDYLRDCALGKEINVISGIDEITTEVRRIGNNINQLTKAANSGVYVVDLSETKEEVKQVWQSLNSLHREVQ